MPNAFIGPWIVEQYGASVTVSLKWGNSSVQTPLYKSWFGHALGHTTPPEDEPSANFQFHEAVEFITKHNAHSTGGI